MTLTELKAALKRLDEISLLEILDLSAEEIVDRFEDLIEERYEELQYKIEEPYERSQREEERHEPLTGELTWKTSNPQALDFDDFDE